MKAFFKRLGFASNGLVQFFRKETNGRIQLVVAILVLGAGFWLQISHIEWLVVLLCIGLVLSLEMLNSAIEKLCDHVHPGRHPQIGWVKDMAAGAVLWAAIASAIVGFLIFWPRLVNLF